MAPSRTIGGWQDFGLAVIFHLLFPLLPVLIELMATARVTETTLTLTASLYAIGIGVASPNRLVFGLAIFAGVVAAIAFGFVTGSPDSFAGARELSVVVIVFFFLTHAVERFWLHVGKREVFFKF
jgi:hypothetical protein